MLYRSAVIEWNSMAAIGASLDQFPLWSIAHSSSSVVGFFFTFEKLNPGFKSPHMFLFATFIIFIIQSNCCSHPNCRKNNHCVCGGTCTCSSVVYWMPPWGKKVMKCLSQFIHSLSNSFSFSAEPKF